MGYKVCRMSNTHNLRRKGSRRTSRKDGFADTGPDGESCRPTGERARQKVETAMTRQEKREAALEDLRRLDAGWRPGEATLAVAPLIDDWLVASEPGRPGYSLYGAVTDHPDLNVDSDVRLMRTSPVVWLDVDARIARTVSRWYRLGEPHPRQMQAMAELEESDAGAKM